MVLTVMIFGVILIAIFVPRWVVNRMTSSRGVAAGSVAALGLGAGFVWLAAKGFDQFGVEEAHAAFDRGFNAWKIMLFLAPAVALHTRRAKEKENT